MKRGRRPQPRFPSAEDTDTRRKVNRGEGERHGRKKTGNGNGTGQTLTTPDLVLLSLLAERPMYGYQAHLELERRCIRDWAAVSKPQIYYSLDKLAQSGLLRVVKSSEPAGGPDRSVFETTERGRFALADALENEAWATQRDHPVFLAFLALSWKARPGVFVEQLYRRRKFLRQELAREKKILLSIYGEVGHKYHEAVWMVNLMILQLRVEILWNLRLERELARRARARHPDYVPPPIDFNLLVNTADSAELSELNEKSADSSTGSAEHFRKKSD